MSEANLRHGELTYRIIGCAQQVHQVLGPGFPEAVYHKAICRELAKCGLAFDSEKPWQVLYDGIPCGEFRPDLVVEAAVIVELKALAALNKDHLAQALSYLKASGLEVGLLVNFGRSSLETRRVVF